MSLFHRHTDYSIEQGNIRYMDGSSLLRPMDMPRSQQIVMAVFVVIAVIIGVRLAAGAITAVNDSNTQNKASVEENLSRTVSYNLPVLTQMADMDDQAILDSLSAAGYTVYNRTAEGTAGLDLVKLPEDVTVADAAAMYAKGVGGLSASQAALLLNGSWTLTVDRSDTPISPRARSRPPSRQPSPPRDSRPQARPRTPTRWATPSKPAPSTSMTSPTPGACPRPRCRTNTTSKACRAPQHTWAFA